jgi:multidrug efflux pump subunit AcrA (membrane-fusion protein)
MMRRTLATACATALLALLVFLWPVELVRDSPIPRVSVRPITTGTIEAPLVRTGTVHAANPINVSPPLSGAVQAVEVVAGAIVHSGDVLARLDASAYTGRLAAARTELPMAEEEVHRSQDDLEEVEQQCSAEARLAAERLIALASLRATEAAVLQANDQLRQSEARLSQAREAVARATAGMQEAVIRAPVDGTVIAIVPAEPLFLIAADGDRVEVRANLVQRDAQTIHVGDTVAIPLGDGTVRGSILAIETDDAVPTALIDVRATARELRPGTLVTFAVESTRRPPTARIPNAALSFSPTANLLDAIGERHIPTVALQPRPEHAAHVWTYDGSWFARIELLTGDHDAEFTELVDGPLRRGDQVVTEASMP